MLKNSILLAVILSASSILSAVTNGDFNFRRSIIAEGKTGFCEFELDSSVYAASDVSFSDLRIFNRDGKEIPFYIESGESNEISENVVFKTWKMDEKYIAKTGTSYIGYQIIEEKDIKVNKLRFFPGEEDFSRQISVYGRYENSDWSFINKGSIYRIKDLVKDELSLDSVCDFRFYRIEFSGKPTDFQSGNIEASFDNSIIVKSDFIKKIDAEYEFSTKNNLSKLSIANKDKYHIRKLEIKSNGYFSRTYRVYRDDGTFLQSGYLYRAVFNNSGIEQTEISFDRIVSGSFYIEIENKDNSPLDISSVEISYISYHLIFDAVKDEEYFLYYGADGITFPDYDIVSFREDIESTAHSSALLGEPEKLEKADKPVSFFSKKVFNVVIVLVSLLLILIISFRLKTAG